MIVLHWETGIPPFPNGNVWACWNSHYSVGPGYDDLFEPDLRMHLIYLLVIQADPSILGLYPVEQIIFKKNCHRGLP